MSTCSSYPKHSQRTVHRLDGVWDFTFLGGDVDLESFDISAVKYIDLIAVPSAFDANPEYNGKRGSAVYRTHTKIQPGVRSRIRFHGTGMWCRVYVDGDVLKEFSLPYSGVWVDVPASETELRELIIVIDNRFDPIRVPLQEPFFDFYAYGGIFRSVMWHELPTVCFERVKVKTVNLESGMIKALISFNGPIAHVINLNVTIDNQSSQKFQQLTVRNGQIHLDLKVLNPTPWSPESPSLHTIRVETGGDDITERFGLRTITTNGYDILLNGKKVTLKGYCRHEVHPQFGPALPLQQHMADLQMLKDLGCNFIRCVHYPHDPVFLDLCDELGFLITQESLGWGRQDVQYRRPEFLDAQIEQTEIMVRDHFNHPSIFLWGFLNEGASDIPLTKELYESLGNCIREEDPSRLVGYATNCLSTDLHLSLCDVICVNTYPGWYSDEPDASQALDSIEPSINDIPVILKKKGLGDKPIIITEIGGGAIYGWHDPLQVYWSEEFQAKMLSIICTAVLGNSKITGLSIWQFCDCRTYASPRALSRPRAFNNKGTLDEYRRPKMAYDTVKEIFLAHKTSDLTIRHRKNGPNGIGVLKSSEPLTEND